MGIPIWISHVSFVEWREKRTLEMFSFGKKVWKNNLHFATHWHCYHHHKAWMNTYQFEGLLEIKVDANLKILVLCSLSDDRDFGWVMASWLIDSDFSQLQSGLGPASEVWPIGLLQLSNTFQKRKYFIHTSKIFQTFRSSRIRLVLWRTN